MSSVIHTFQNRASALPVSQPDANISTQPTIRRRLSSLSLNIPPPSSASSATAAWALRRTKSVSSAGESVGKSIQEWWDLGWSWILSRKVTFAADLEMNEEEKAVLGPHGKGSWHHVLFKVRSCVRKLFGTDSVGLPQTCRFDDEPRKTLFRK